MPTTYGNDIVYCLKSHWGVRGYCRQKWVLQVQIICKFSNERTCKRNKDVQGLSCGFEDKDKCTDCGLCEKVCPIINTEDWHESGGFEKPHCYALINKNIEVRFDSTSGGAFSALADEIYKKSGYVGGAIYNEDWSVSQFLSSSREDLSRLRSSKYLQSHLDGFYIAVREALKTGKPVLVCGSPCQMAAMKRFLRKSYENLMVVDYICRGIASPLYFKQFINYLEQKHHSTVVYYKAKSKELGWRTLSTRVEFANKDVDYILGKENPWLSMQYKIPEVCRPSCFDCPFKGFPRTSDLTIGDLWSSPGSIPKELDSDIGTSVVFANNEKGADMLNKCKKKIIWSDFSFEEATKGNYHLMYSLKHSEHNREDFFKTLNISFQACIDKYMPDFGQTQKSLKEKIKNVACFIKGVTGAAGWNIGTWIKNMRYNLFCRQIETDILERKFIIINKYCTLDLHPKAKLVLNAPFIMGYKRIKGSKLESRLLIEENGRMEIKYGSYTVYYGADIQVFKGAHLEIGGDASVNVGLNLICANHISIGRWTGGGRNVTIRDNNGEHHISIRGYKTSIPIVIKEHVWLTENCTIMPGTTIEAGAIISARSVVQGHVPSFSIVSGDPAKVIETKVYWKS